MPETPKTPSVRVQRGRVPAVTIPRLTCNACGHTWIPRKPVIYLCPSCHSPKWAEPKGGRA